MVVITKIPGALDDNARVIIEGYFYETVNKQSRKPLRAVALRRFEKAEAIAPYLNLSVEGLIHFAANSNRIHGVIMPDESFVLHPDGCFVEIGKRGQKYLKSLTVLPRNLRRFLKSLPEGTPH